MRNLTFSVLVATLVLITLAVWPIGYAEAEKTPAESQKEKRNSGEGDSSVSLPEKSAFYQKWEDDDAYGLPGSNSYEDDGYGYDDDEYDHFNYKRYDSDKSKLSEDMKMTNEESKGTLSGEKRDNVVVPEATTIELLSFQAKNMNPMSDNMQQPKEDSKMKPFAMKKPFSEKSDEKETLVDEKLKKKTSEEQKQDGNSNDKNTGNVKVAENKLSETKDPPENKAEKGKVDAGTTGSSVQKENAQITGGKEQEEKEEKSGLKMKADEEKMDAEVAKDDFKDKNLFAVNRIDEYQDEFENMNDPVLTDDEKASEDNGMNLAGLRDSRNELPYQYSHNRPEKYMKKKDTLRRIHNSNALPRESHYTGKEPFHLEFPVADLESADYHRNYQKSLKRFKNMGESARILSQGDTPSPYADEGKKYLAPKVIEEEQRKRRSRLRRLKANPMFPAATNRRGEEEDDAYDYGYPPRSRMQYGLYRRNILGEDTGVKNYHRLLRDAYDDEFEEEGKKNMNKRQDDAYAEKQKGQGKSAWSGGEYTVQKKKIKESNIYEEPGRYNTPLVLLQRNDNGQQAVKTFIDGRYKNEEGVDSEDLARLLSRDSNYVVLRKVPGKEQIQEVTDNGSSKSSIADLKKDKLKLSGATMKAEPDIGALKEGHSDHPLKRKENRIEDLSDFFKGDVQDDRDFDEKREMLMSIENRLSQYQRGEPNKKVMYKPSLSQAYRHMKDLEERESFGDPPTDMTEKSGQTGERLLKSFKKDGKEFLLVNKPLNLNGKGQDVMIQNLDGQGIANVAPGNAQMPRVVPANGMKTDNTYQMIPSGSFQEIKLPEVQKGNDDNRKYFLYGTDNDISNASKHEVKVMQGDLSVPPDSTYNQPFFKPQNKASSMKNTQAGKAQSLEEGKGYDKSQQCLADSYHPTSTVAEGFKRITKKDKTFGGLERFMRDFQDFSQGSTYKSTDLPGMTLQELTSHGDRHLQKLNNLLKEIMTNKAEETGNGRVKNLKRGMFQKYRDQKNWPIRGEGGGDAQVRSGKWTSVVYDGSSDKINPPGESSIKDRKDAPAMLRKDTLPFKRTKRQSGYDSKDSTKMLEQKVKSMPYNVQPQPLFPNANGNANSNQQHKSPSRTCLQLPPDKLMELLNYFRSERDEFDKEKMSNAGLCRRSAPAEDNPVRRKLLAVSEGDPLNEAEKKKAECVRKSFERYLDPLVRKIGEYETTSGRDKREIELDESMPNDFQNFLVTSLGSFGSQKRGVVKKDEAVWDSEEGHDTLGKRDTNGNKKNSVSKEDATNIRIKIVDGNGNGEATEGNGVSKAESHGDSSVHEVYLITNADTKKRKFAGIRSDQSPQKQPMTNHLPQVETVYNPSPGSNKAQVEKISGDTQLKGKCAQPPTVYNATASMMEDNIIRNNLRTGNINTFTYQHKEEPTPYPLQGQTNPPSSEFEMLNSKSLSRSKPFRVMDYGDRYATSDIIYKDQTPNGVSVARPSYHSNPMVRVIKSGAESSRKDYEEETGYAEYDDGESFDERQDYEEPDSGRQGNSKAQEHLDPKMVALWHDYARTHLSPERHKEAMEREFQEAYFRSSGQTRYVGGNLNLGMNLIQNRQREKLSKRMTSEPAQIGRRFFYTFKSEVPDEEYYSLYREPPNLKLSKTRLTENNAKPGVAKLKVNFEGKRVKRSNIERRHLTESHYQKYHKKNLEDRREENEREKRDALADFLKADMMRRIEEEKKIRSKVKGLSSDLTKYDIPLNGGLSPGEELPLPDLFKHLEEEKMKESHQYGNLKSGSPDVFKTFEIKRGRRQECRTEDNYQDGVFLKSINTRKVKKYSNEGFEPLTFSDKSSFYSGVPLDSSSSVNRRAGDKKSKVKEAGGPQKFQKMTHGFSHDAPLLTANSPLNSPKIFDALKDSPPSKEDPSLRKHQEASLLEPAESRLKSGKTSEPMVSAVLVLTKREEPGVVETGDPSPFRLVKRSGKERRNADWLKDDLTRLRPTGQSPEIVNEEVKCRSSDDEPPANNKMVDNVKKSCFPFKQMRNDRNEGGTGIGNSGEDILESILGRVESNPHFRRVIGPGLKWRGRKCYTETENCQEMPYQPPNRCLFVRQVRKILARFVKDIETLASQDFTRNVCCKLDSTSNRFLHELLDMPFEGAGTCKRRKFLGSYLKDSIGRLNMGSSLNAEATENRRDLVARLLEEYRNLPDDEKRSVEVLGQYLNHELNALNRALNTDGAVKHDERAVSGVPRDGGQPNTEKATQEAEKKRSYPENVRVTNAETGSPEDRKTQNTGYGLHRSRRPWMTNFNPFLSDAVRPRMSQTCATSTRHRKRKL